MPVLLEAAAHRDRSQSSNPVQSTLADLRRSPDRVERGSIYLGRVVEDGSPVLVPRDVFREHAHGLGDSGAGKTSLFLCPIIEQLVVQGDCSVIVLDLRVFKQRSQMRLGLRVAEAGKCRLLPIRKAANRGDSARRLPR